MVQKISQLREGSLNLKFGIPARAEHQPYSLTWLVLSFVDVPIIRRAGLPPILGEVTEEVALLDGVFSAMLEALVQARSSWRKSH